MTLPTSTWSLGDEVTVRPCPLCQGRRFEVLATSDRYDMDIQTVGCLGCGLVLTNPQPTEASLNRFYAEHYRHYYQKVAEPSADYIRQYRKDERASETAEYLMRHGALPENGAVLDIGASEGCILKALGDRQPTLLRVAVEPNPLFGAYAVRHAGCTLYNDLPPVRALGQRFDLIVLNHVFEHLQEPVSYLRGLSTLLSPAGRIYIDVPDLARYENLKSLHIAHLYHFTQRTLAAVAIAAGYAVEAIEAHEPLMHPASIRVLLRVDQGGLTPAASDFLAEAWPRLRQIDRGAHRFHRARWSSWQRLRHSAGANLGLRRRFLEC